MPWLVAATLLLGACAGGGGSLAQLDADVDTTSTTGSAGSVDAGTTRRKPIPTSRLGGPTNAAQAARVVETTERGIRGTNRDPARLRSLGRRQQLAYRAISAHPKWVDDVIAALPDDLRTAVQANIDAGATLGNLTGEAPPGFPDWDVLPPEPAATLRGYYAEAEASFGVPWAYLAAIHLSETRMGRIHGNSTAGAQGPMQFIPDTWAAYGEGDINDNRDAILAAARYLAANGAPGDIDHALFRYNNDDRYVAAIKAYASVMLADPLAYDGYHQWRVFYATTEGTYVLPEGWSGP